MNRSHQQHRGVATLTITVVLLVLTTIVVIMASRVGILDLRMSANQTRHKEAFAVAEAGLDFAVQRFAREFKLNFDGTNSGTVTASLATIVTNSQIASPTTTTGGTPGSNEAYFTATIVASGASFGSIPVYTVRATGIGSDGTGTATVQRQITMAYVFGGTIPDVPVIVGGAVGTGGNFNIVANPNGGGAGIPVSVWSSGNITATAASATCYAQYYDGNNAQCSNPSGNTENISNGTSPATAISTYNTTYPDLLPNDPNFPTDIFNFIFGVQQADWATKKNEAASNGQLVSSCAPIATAGANAGNNFTLWWVAGNCSFSGNTTIGSPSNPVIIVIDDHALQVSGNVKIYGIVYLFNNPDDVATPSASLTGTTEIIGSFISDMGGAAMSGSYSVVYDPNIVTAFKSEGSNYNFSYIPASWRDF